MLLTDTQTHGQMDGRTDAQSDCNKPLAGFNKTQYTLSHTGAVACPKLKLTLSYK